MWATDDLLSNVNTFPVIYFGGEILCTNNKWDKGTILGHAILPITLCTQYTPRVTESGSKMEKSVWEICSWCKKKKKGKTNHIQWQAPSSNSMVAFEKSTCTFGYIVAYKSYKCGCLSHFVRSSFKYYNQLSNILKKINGFFFVPKTETKLNS